MKYFNFWASGFAACSAMANFIDHNTLMGIVMVALSLINIVIGVMTND